MPHDVFYDVIGSVVATGRFALLLVVFEVDLAFVDGRQWLLDLLGRLVDFLTFFLRDGKLLSGDLELELQQPFIDATQMPYAERFEVEEHKRLGAAVHAAGQWVEAEREIAIRNGVGSK